MFVIKNALSLIFKRNEWCRPFCEGSHIYDQDSCFLRLAEVEDQLSILKLKRMVIFIFTVSELSKIDNYDPS